MKKGVCQTPLHKDVQIFSWKCHARWIIHTTSDAGSEEKDCGIWRLLLQAYVTWQFLNSLSILLIFIIYHIQHLLSDRSIKEYFVRSACNFCTLLEDEMLDDSWSGAVYKKTHVLASPWEISSEVTVFHCRKGAIARRKQMGFVTW